MNRTIFAIASLLLAVFVAEAGRLPKAVQAGGTEKVISVTPPDGSGLDAIFVARRVDGSVHFSVPADGKAVQWYRFSALGAGYAEEVTAGISDSGQLSTLTPAEGDMGYYSDAAGDRTYFWLIDYSKHPYDITSLNEAPASEQDCGRVALLAPGSAEELTAYTINGRRLTVSRDITLTYNTLVWDEGSHIYTNAEKTETLTHITSAIHTEAPLCATVFTLSGDRFLKEWGQGQTVDSPVVPPRAVACRTSAEQAERDADNEVKPPSQGRFGGSAPCEMTFTAAVTDAAIFHEWQISRQSDFEDILLHEPDLELNYTFTEEGTTYVRFYCANADASCDAYGDTYEISLGESSLKCPNAFSPFNEDGNNDIWKVSYSSIISFECSIFNRRGKLMKSFSDPSDGWDGKSGGKFVPSGVYYYVIKAVGADGRKYNLSGDINIVDYR